jgi:hypothetical protein
LSRGERNRESSFHNGPFSGEVQVGYDPELVFEIFHRRRKPRPYQADLNISRPRQLVFRRSVYHETIEMADSVRLQTITIPDMSNGHMAHLDIFSYGPTAPMSGIGWFGMKRSLHNGFDFIFFEAFRTGFAHFVFQARNSCFQKMMPPKEHGGPRSFQVLSNPPVGQTRMSQKTNRSQREETRR